MPLGTPLPPMKGQMPIGQNPGQQGAYSNGGMNPAMGGQVDPTQSGMAGQSASQAGFLGMSGQLPPNPNQMNSNTDYAARQRQMLNAHLQLQGQRAMQAAKPSGGFFSRFFGGQKASSAQAMQRMQATQAQNGQNKGLLNTLGFGRNPNAANTQATKSYAARRSEAYKDYRKMTMDRNKMEKDIARRQKLAESAKSSSMQRFHTSKMNKLQKSFEKGEKAYKKSYLGYKYTK